MSFTRKLSFAAILVTMLTVSSPLFAASREGEGAEKETKTFFTDRSLGLIRTSMTPFEFGILSPFQLFSGETKVYGIRMSALYTFNKAVYGLDAGVIGDSDDSYGIQVNLCNLMNDTQGGIGISMANISQRNMYGVQFGAYNQAGIQDIAKIFSGVGDARGCQFGVVNLTNCNFKGGQLGLVNISNTVYNGIQIGFVNGCWGPDEILNDFFSQATRDAADNMQCIQIGFLNFNPNGYLPLTLVFNFCP
ncbi:hypothetical protein P0136_07775 [Lentisphaerota bacterium ZTH]|nr:hypothetical protein JYG24_01110 [Lentisphaerota bacterium]WET05263.1 hypothetical protein P0136_07775 [Lentisphaerota bacterium ZTH]